MRRFRHATAKTITSRDGISLHYEVDYVGRDKKLLFLVHGLAGDLSAWDSERIILHELGYSTLAVDLRGHGFSGRPKQASSYSLTLFAHDIADIARAENTREMILVGHCFGGVVVLVAENQYPDIAKGVVLVDTTYKAPIFFKHKTLGKLAASIISRVARFLPNGGLDAYRDYSKIVYAEEWSTVGILRNMFYVSLRRFLLMFDTLLTLDLSASLQNVGVPTLIITGGNDTVFRPTIAQEIHRRIKHSLLEVIPGANHIVVLNNPAELTASITAFLKKLRFVS